MEELDVLTIVNRSLKAAGYDGLVSPGEECACLVDDLAPCGDLRSDCVAGVRRPMTKEEIEEELREEADKFEEDEEPWVIDSTLKPRSKGENDV